MKKTILLLAFVAIAIAVFSSIQVQSKNADCNGGVTVIAPNCIGMKGCLINLKNDIHLPFVIGDDGTAFLDHICAGYYYACIPDCGTSNVFYSNGSSDLAAPIVNDAQCHCD